MVHAILTRYAYRTQFCPSFIAYVFLIAVMKKTVDNDTSNLKMSLFKEEERSEVMYDGSWNDVISKFLTSM